jgi:hypothetical protein
VCDYGAELMARKRPDDRVREQLADYGSWVAANRAPIARPLTRLVRDGTRLRVDAAGHRDRAPPRSAHPPPGATEPFARGGFSTRLGSSGGPALYDRGDREEIVRVLFGGRRADSPDSIFVATYHPTNARWLRAALSP